VLEEATLNAVIALIASIKPQNELEAFRSLPRDLQVLSSFNSASVTWMRHLSVFTGVLLLDCSDYNWR
jgi:hypothetical protein